MFNNDTSALDSDISVVVACKLLGKGEIFGLARQRWLHCQSEGKQGDALKCWKQVWMLLVRYPVPLYSALSRFFLHIDALYTLREQTVYSYLHFAVGN